MIKIKQLILYIKHICVPSAPHSQRKPNPTKPCDHKLNALCTFFLPYCPPHVDAIKRPPYCTPSAARIRNRSATWSLSVGATVRRHANPSQSKPITGKIDYGYKDVIYRGMCVYLELEGSVQRYISGLLRFTNGRETRYEKIKVTKRLWNLSV